MKKIIFVFMMMAGSIGLFAQSINDPFFEKVDYIGAFGTYNWTQGWSNFDPQNTAYPATTITIPAGDITTNTTWSSGISPVLNAASFMNPALSDPFFTPVTYVGAFGATDWTAGWANFNPQNTVYPPTTVTIPAGDITTNTTWTSGNVYLLNGWVYVKDGATLTIEPGTIIRGDKVNKGALIIERGGKLVAEGTAAQPIVFTSNQSAGSRDYGDWGGIILCGRAGINQPGGEATIEGGVGALYGGGLTPNDADNSGSLQFVRIEFPGIAFAPNNEINGLTMGGVGSGTTLEHIQVSFCGDDSFEWFGGTVNAKYLIAFRGWDDEFDTDNGYRGKVQFAFALRDPAIADVSGSNGFESDNDASGSGNTPVTAPVFCNISFFGPLATPSTVINSNYKRSMHLRRNTRLNVFNSVFTGYPTGLFIDGTAAQSNATNNLLKIENCILSGMTNNFASAFEQNYFLNPARNNTVLSSNSLLHFPDAYNLTNPSFLPNATPEVYLLNGWVYVKDGATLTIEPGTIIRGDKVNKGALIIERGGKINAQGTQAAPIVFTSNQAVGARDYGDWGGIILCGKATINQAGGEATIEGGVGALYGGGTSPDDNDNSGVLKYVRIEFPGIAFAPNNEINGLTMGGVGNGTSIENIQVSFCGDDSYEWFGGTVNAKRLIAFRGWDDEFDTDNGFRGMIQFAVALRDPAIADVSGSNGLESDNDASGSGNTPVTNPVFSNVSIYGPMVTPSTVINTNYKRSMHLRRNTKLNVFNSTFSGYPVGLLIDGNNTQANANNNELKVEYSIMTGMTNFFNVPAGQTWTLADARNWYNNPARKNDTLALTSGLMITDPYNLSNPNFLPLTGSPVFKRSYWVRTLSGNLHYKNVASTPLNNSTVILKDASNTLLEQTTTNATGYYAFKVMDGTYNLDASTTKNPGGINSSDALLAMKHFVGMQPMTGLYLEAANVNASGPVNATDALMIQQRFVGVISTFPAGTWCFDKGSVVISGSDLNRNIAALSYGDCNGNFTPPAKTQPSVTLQTVPSATPYENLPLIADSDIEIGAVSLILEYPAGTEIRQVVMNEKAGGHFLYQASDGQLIISWFGTEPLQLQKGESLLTIDADAGITFTMNENSAIADAAAQTYAAVNLIMPKFTATNIENLSCRLYPNPSQGHSTLTLSLVRDETISLKVANAFGQIVADLGTHSLDKGIHSIQLNIGELESGLYFLNVQGESLQSLRFVLNK